MAMEKLHAVHQDPRFDFIVLDTPPTTNALDFLDAPQKLVGAIDSPVMRWFVQQLEGGGGLSLVSRGAAYVLRGLARFTGAAFLEQVGQFVSDMNELFGGFRQRAQAVYDDLRGDDVAFLIVSSPSPVAVAEAVHFSKRLDGYGIEPRAVVVNRVHRFDPPAAELAPDALRGIVDDEQAAAALIARMQAAGRDSSAMAARDQEGVRRLREHLTALAETRQDGGPAYVEVPAFDRDVYDLSALARVGSALLA
jgi:anion-transporting  ArsA/GET3 family ATPase